VANRCYGSTNELPMPFPEFVDYAAMARASGIERVHEFATLSFTSRRSVAGRIRRRSTAPSSSSGSAAISSAAADRRSSRRRCGAHRVAQAQLRAETGHPGRHGHRGHRSCAERGHFPEKVRLAVTERPSPGVQAVQAVQVSGSASTARERRHRIAGRPEDGRPSCKPMPR
jgi:hypothetical protein